MATGGLYGNSPNGTLIAESGTESTGLYGKSPNGSMVAAPSTDTSGLYGNAPATGGTYFEWFVFQEAVSQPATPTGGSWNFTTNVGTPPSGWSLIPPSNPVNQVWVSIALVNSRATSSLVWSVPGLFGVVPNITFGTVVTGNPGTNAAVVNTGTATNPNLIFTIPRGDVGATGATGATGPKGDTGNTGAAATIAVGTTSTGAAGSYATVTNVGTSGAAIFNFVIPRGDTGATGATGAQGIQGNPGAAATIAVGTTSTGSPGSAASVNNTGTSSAAVFNFSIPQGATGAAGVGIATGGTTGQVLTKASGTNYDTTWTTITGTLNYQGSWNASTNTPTLTSSVGTNGYYYVVTVAGSTNLNGITDWQIGDWAIFNGSVWQKIDQTNTVTSVNGQTGAVSLSYSDVGAFPATATTGTGNVVLATGPTLNNPAISNYETFTPTTPPTYAEGEVWYDSASHALAYYNDSSNAIVHIGQDLQVKVINNTGSTIANGSPVYITGTSSGQTYPNIALAKADVAATSAVIGLTNGSIANGSIGYVTAQGGIDNVNTGTFTVGQVLYLSPYSAGQLMNTIPPTGITVQVGIVSYVNSSTGKIYVKQTTPLNVPASIISGQVSIAQGGTGASTASGARTNLGLGTIATQDASNVVITGGTIDNTVIGGTTPIAGTFTTLTATGQASLGGAAGSEAFRAVTTASAVNWVESVGGVAGSTNFPRLFANGSDATTYLNLASKGSGGLRFWTNSTTGSSGQEQFRVSNTASAVNYVQVTGAATGGSPTLSMQGSDSSISLAFQSKGSGTGAYFTNSAYPTNNYFSATSPSGIASANRLNASGAATAFSPVLSTVGSDTNISQVFQSKGTGAIDLAAGSSGVNISNGGTVTAVTTTANGGYTSAPTVSVSAPTTAGGVQAVVAITTMTPTGGLVIVSGGTGYSVNDVLTIVGGTATSGTTQITVSAVSSGVITAAAITSYAIYSTLPPSNPATVTGGTGTGATFTVSHRLAGALSITTAGSGYVEQPTVSFSGGGGSGAAAYATVGSATVVRSLGSSSTFYTSGGAQFGIVDNSNPTSYPYVSGGNGTGAIGVLGATNSGLALSPRGTSNLTFQTNTFSQTQMVVSHTASAVNYVQVTGAATGGTPTISVQGSDTNAGMLYTSKGFGAHQFRGYGGNNIYGQFYAAQASPVNYIQFGASSSGNALQIQAAGSDTNIDLTLTPKGTGSVVATAPVKLQGYTVATLPTAGTIGRTAYVTDAVAPTFLGVLVGGGAIKTPVFDNGTAWVSY